MTNVVTTGVNNGTAIFMAVVALQITARHIWFMKNVHDKFRDNTVRQTWQWRDKMACEQNSFFMGGVFAYGALRTCYVCHSFFSRFSAFFVAFLFQPCYGMGYN